MSAPDRRALARSRRQALSIRRQCVLLGVARSGVYRPPRPANDNDLALMRRIDELFTAWPFLGSRRMTAMLRADGLADQSQAGAAADAPDGDRGARAEAAHDEAGAGAQDLPVSAARTGDRPAEPGVGGRHHLHPDRARLPLPGGDHRLGEPGGAGVAAVEHDGRLVLRRRRSRRRWRASAGRRSSTPTRAASSPAPPSPARWRPPASGSRWTAAVAGWTTCSSSGCGAR